MSLLETIEAKDVKVGYQISFEGCMWKIVEVLCNEKSNYYVDIVIARGKSEIKRMTVGRKAVVHVDVGKDDCIEYVIHAAENLLSALRELQLLEKNTEESLQVVENVSVSKSDIRKIIVGRVSALANECKNRSDGL